MHSNVDKSSCVMTPTRVILESLLIPTIEIAAVKVEQSFGSIPSCLIMPSQTASTLATPYVNILVGY